MKLLEKIRKVARRKLPFDQQVMGIDIQALITDVAWVSLPGVAFVVEALYRAAQANETGAHEAVILALRDAAAKLSGIEQKGQVAPFRFKAT